jgi:hypothetical protein
MLSVPVTLEDVLIRKVAMGASNSIAFENCGSSISREQISCELIGEV